MCLICFLKNEYQFLLRESSMIRSDRLEHSLDRYKNEFINGFKEKLNLLCKNHDNDTNKIISDELKTVKLEDLDKLFNNIKDLYIKWINAEIPLAIEKLKGILEEIDYNMFNEELTNKMLFRARESESFISHWDMFHIPFNKRYLINNQRYSLNGQPLLYLASSPYGAYKELGNHSALRIASFTINSYDKFKIYQNVNMFEYYILDNDADYIVKAENMVMMEELRETNYAMKMLKHMILSSCCSFRRRDDTKRCSFSEEYVIPQVLTIVLKMLNFNGIKYISTKSYDDKQFEKNYISINLLYSNYCIFTNYNHQNSEDKSFVYDKKLYKKFDVSNPILFCNNINHDFTDENRILKYIKYIDDTIKVSPKYDNLFYSLANDLEVICSLKSDNNYINENKDDENKDNNLISTLTKYLKNDVINEKLLYNEEKYFVEKFIDMHILFIRNEILNISEKKEV